MPLLSMALITIHLDAAVIQPTSLIGTATNATCMDAPDAVVREKAAEYDRIIESCAQVGRDLRLCFQSASSVCE